jgi:phosphoribosylaminoimidazole-succinocarboxamide synthase
MLPLELVTRRYAWGTYLLRHPEYQNSHGQIHRFEELVWEFFHKWSVITHPVTNEPYQMDEETARSKYLRNGVWQKGVYTDPYVHITDAGWVLYPPKEDLSKSRPLMTIHPVLEKSETKEVIDRILMPAFYVLESAWEKVTTDHGRIALVDLKLEIGRRLSDNKLVIADVVDNDSWRIWQGGDPARQLDKQLFRENHPLREVAENYELVTRLTDRFIDPHPDA